MNHVEYLKTSCNLCQIEFFASSNFSFRFLCVSFNEIKNEINEFCCCLCCCPRSSERGWLVVVPPHFAFFPYTPTLLHPFTPCSKSSRTFLCSPLLLFFCCLDAGKRKERYLKWLEELGMKNLSNTTLEPTDRSIWSDNLIKLQLQIIGKTFTNHCDLVFFFFFCNSDLVSLWISEFAVSSYQKYRFCSRLVQHCRSFQSNPINQHRQRSN